MQQGPPAPPARQVASLTLPLDAGCGLCIWEGCHESRRCSRDTYPESYITKYTGIRRIQSTSGCGNPLSTDFHAIWSRSVIPMVARSVQGYLAHSEVPLERGTPVIPIFYARRSVKPIFKKASVSLEWCHSAVHLRRIDVVSLNARLESNKEEEKTRQCNKDNPRPMRDRLRACEPISGNAIYRGTSLIIGNAARTTCDSCKTGCEPVLAT